ncbi:MAG TPA: DUF4410 domain-containing protein [Pseudolabrys sp.]
MRLLSVCLVALALAGCAQSHVTGLTIGYSGAVPRPKTIVVSDFVFSSDVVALDRGFTARLSRKLGELPPDQRKQRTAERVNDEIVAAIVSTLREAGLEAQAGSEEGLSLSDDAVIVSGRLRAIDEGNSTQRHLIGFGAGRSGVVADMALTHVGNGAKKELLSFTAEAESRRRPGAIVTAPISAATSVAVSAASAVGGVAAEKLSADVQAQARSLGHAAGERIVAYAKERGWLAPASPPADKPQS